MNSKKWLSFFSVSVILLFSCETNIDYTVKGYKEKIIVEGKIENGDFPMVYLSLNVPLWKTVDSTTIMEHIIRHAKVTISDGKKTEILTSKWDLKNFPPYVYKATDLKGEEGKKYDLIVEYGGYTLYSSTTIPREFQILSIKSKNSDIDTLRILSVEIDAGNEKGKSYRVFSKKRKDNRFIETPLLYNNTLTESGKLLLDISPNVEKTDNSFAEGKYFAVGDIVEIKVCAIDSVATQYYKDISMFSGDEMSKFFMSEVKNLNSNISSPGAGIWCGNAVRKYIFEVK